MKKELIEKLQKSSDYEEKMDKLIMLSFEDQMSLLYMWIKQNVISKNLFYVLIKSLTQN